MLPTQIDMKAKRHPRRLDGDVYDQLYIRISSGKYPLGSKLPSEYELAAEFSVSRPIVRTALARLRDSGLIVSRRGSGSYVSDATMTDAGSFGPIKSVEDIDHWYTFRRLIEGESAFLAASNTTPEFLEKLTNLAVEMDRYGVDGEEKFDVDRQFHDLIADTSGNRFLAEAVHMMRPHLMFISRFVRSLSKTGYKAGKIAMGGEHDDIINALKTADPDLARTAMIAHIDGSQRRVFKGE